MVESVTVLLAVAAAVAARVDLDFKMVILLLWLLHIDSTVFNG